MALVCTFGFQPQQTIAQTGCGECWQNGLKNVTFNLFGATHILCNCDSVRGDAGPECVCNPS